ncbi:glycoside hydrolase family 2 protein [Caldicellulosiruptoraceae bacterium PP1]
MEILLNHLNWELKGYWPWVPMLGKSVETGKDLVGITDWIEAEVPGSIQYDLYKAGLIENPYIDLNSLKCEWVENRWWMYRTHFEKPMEHGTKYELIFKGIDYKAMFILNNHILGEHEGMYEPAIFDITDIIKNNDSFDLKILFMSPPDEMGQIGWTSKTTTQKSRFNYKWDFGTRLVNIGIWDDVVLKIHQEVSIADSYITTDVIDKKGIINIKGTIIRNTQEINTENLKIVYKLLSPDNRLLFERVEGYSNIISKTLELENPYLWFPNGYGEQPLYKLILELKDERKLYDKKDYSIGIRKLEYMHNENSPADSLPYTFVINGKKIYIKGVNLTPLDHTYGNVSKAHYEWMILCMKNLGVNMVRLWGGGIIEREIFYDLCDKYGILIWQEFIQSSSGLDNIPSKIPSFLELLEKNSKAAIIGRRNHVSLTVWSGGNELTFEENKPVDYTDYNISLLRALVEKYDPQRLFLPTSASGPVEFVTTQKGVSHDVHGRWEFQGNPFHYELYGESDSLFHSEFGNDGMSSMKTINKFLSKKYHKVARMRECIVFRHHGEWWGTLDRDLYFFGEIKNIEDFSEYSQWIQAEGLRFIVEANRRRQFRNSGSIIWQFNEPWPNLSCTSLVEYYGDPKMAYYWVKKAYNTVHASLDYRRLDYKIGQQFNAALYIDSDKEYKNLKVLFEIINKNNKIIYERHYITDTILYKSKKVDEYSIEVTEDFTDSFIVLIRVYQDDKEVFRNSYYFSTLEKEIYKGFLQLRKQYVSSEQLTEWENVEGFNFIDMKKAIFKVKNISENIALHVNCQEESNAFWYYCDDNFEILLPNEEKEITVYCTKKDAGGFLKEDTSNTDVPLIKFYSF